ncbi:MAG: RidA family protein, partial [Alphaproteobacteria bacterium]
MSSDVAGRLAELGIVLPPAVAPVANYVPLKICGSQLFISGQVPIKDGKPGYLGIVGDKITMAQAGEAARVCAINILSQANTALGGDLDRIVQCIRMGIFVAAPPDFTDHP